MHHASTCALYLEVFSHFLKHIKIARIIFALLQNESEKLSLEEIYGHRRNIFRGVEKSMLLSLDSF